MPKQTILKPGWYLVKTAAPHDLVRDDDGDPLRFDDIGNAEEYADANFQKHDVLFLFVPRDNFAWGENRPCPEGEHWDPDLGQCVPD